MNIIYPAFLMMGLTLVLLGTLGFVRAAAVKNGEIDARYFRSYRNYEEPEKLAVFARHISNHFETPVIFYALCAFALLTGQTGTSVVLLAWAYFALRCVHSYVHLTSNRVMVRFRVFGLSLLVLWALWLTILVGYLR